MRNHLALSYSCLGQPFCEIDNCSVCDRCLINVQKELNLCCFAANSPPEDDVHLIIILMAQQRAFRWSPEAHSPSSFPPAR